MGDLSEVRGMIFDVQRYSVHDGPGIRTIAFLKGCPLRCKWCCNPESFVKEPQTMMMHGEQVVAGREVSVGEMVDTFLKDMVYYRRSKGGITLSGGEPLLQPGFSGALLQACKQKWIHTAIETCVHAEYHIIESLLPHLDLLMVDVKHMSSQKHREFTGLGNELILENVRRLSAQPGAQVIVRVPVVPGFNDTTEEISQIAAFISTLPGVSQLHLLPYHRLGEEKYRGLGIEYPMAGIEPLPASAMAPLREAAALVSGIHCQIGG